MKNMVHELRPAQQSRLTPPTDRDRRAFSHGSVRFGCTASLSPACFTALRPMRSADASTAAVTPSGLRVTRPAYWSRIGPGYGRDSAALVRRSACGGCAAPILSHPLPSVTAPDRRQRAPTPSTADPECGRYLLSPAYQSRAGPRAGPSRAALQRGRACGGCVARYVRSALYPPYTPVCPYARRAVWAVFRPLHEPRRAVQQQARAWADPARSSWAALGRGTCLYRRYSDFIQRYAQK